RMWSANTASPPRLEPTRSTNSKPSRQHWLGLGQRSFASTPLRSSRQSVQTHQQTLTAKGSSTLSLVPSISLCVCGPTLRPDLLRASFYFVVFRPRLEYI